ncbi:MULTISPECIES: hypothetical protein [Phenylobacterium]|uniref:Uncharacterized protein n=1 Tax=Phenylobacterium koreense TaxID=266125 RepID=A0ABV2EDP1_9CAUL
MEDDDDLPPGARQRRKGIPLVLWLAIGLGLVFAFLALLRFFYPPGMGL